MSKRVLSLVVIMTVGLCGLARAEELIEIYDEQVWEDFEEGGFDPNDTVQILAGGSLTVNKRSGITDGRHVIVEEGGVFTMNDRLDMDSEGVITMNGGEFICNNDLKFPDSGGDQNVHIWLYGGLMVVNEVESRADRGSTVHVGGGIMRVGNTDEGGRADPSDTEEWNIVTIPPCAKVVITELEDNWKEISASGTLIQVGDEQVWEDLESGGFGADGVLQILAGGNLTVNGRSAVKDGMELVIEEGGVFTISGRLDIDEDGVITMNGGEFHSNDDLKFPDNDTGLECHIWLYAD